MPAARPLTIPVSEPIPAVPGAAELQVPPGVMQPSSVLLPTQTLAAPVIAAGNGFTVIGRVVVQPVPRE